MRVFVYGAGYYGECILETLKKYPEIELIGFVDSYKTGELNGYPIISMQDLTKQDTSIPVVITVANMLHLKKIYSDLRMQGVKELYYYMHKSFCASGDFFHGECAELTGDLENVLMAAEIHLADYCNLNCKGCTHYSPIFERVLPDTKKRLADIKKLSDLFENVFVFSLLGGEPLLNPQLEEYVTESRKALPKAELQLVTNGLLIPKLEEKVLGSLKQNKVTVVISEYQPTHKMMDAIKETLERFQIDYSIRKYDVKQTFYKPLSTLENSKYPRTCISPGCVNICDGKIARCPQLMYLPKLNERFDLHLPETGIMNLNDFSNGKEVLTKLEEEVPLCNHCIEYEMDWGLVGL